MKINGIDLHGVIDNKGKLYTWNFDYCDGWYIPLLKAKEECRSVYTNDNHRIRLVNTGGSVSE